MAEHTNRLLAVFGVASDTTFEIAASELRVPAAAGAAAGKRRPIRAAVPDRLTCDIHAFGLMTSLAEVARVVAGGALLGAARGCQRVGQSEI